MPVTRSAFNRDRVGCRRCYDQDCLHEPFGGASSQRRCTIQDNINLQAYVTVSDVPVEPFVLQSGIGIPATWERTSRGI